MSTASTRALDRILKGARTRLPGVLDDVLKFELFGVLDDFFRSTRIWREDITVRAHPDRTTYEFVSEEHNALITTLLGVERGGVPVAAYMETPGELVLTHPPAAVEDLTVTVALTVTDPVTSAGYPETPDWAIERYWGGLQEGLLAVMMSQPAKPYSNAQMATYYGRRFIALKAAARASGGRSYLFGGQRWRFPQAFAVGRK